MSDDRPDLAPLELIAREVAAEWGVELGEPFALARYSYVAGAGDDAVLKVTPPEDDEADEEADALDLWAGDGAVPLLRSDRRRRGLLLERARPGTDLSRLPEDEATRLAVEVGLRLWRPATAPFRWIGDHVPRWLESAEGDLGARARELYASLDVGRDTLVHGDFHHHNVLRSERGWIAIDPKPMLGEPEYDVPSFLWNPLPCRLRVEHLEARLAAFAAAGLDEERMRVWTVIRGAYLQPQEAEALGGLLS
ncbi:MAG: aminoglycoside phosphotransferase family protein [Gaiellaceae bacterium]